MRLLGVLVLALSALMFVTDSAFVASAQTARPATKPSPPAAKADADIKQLLINESIARYVGNCPCHSIEIAWAGVVDAEAPTAVPAGNRPSAIPRSHREDGGGLSGTDPSLEPTCYGWLRQPPQALRTQSPWLGSPEVQPSHKV